MIFPIVERLIKAGETTLIVAARVLGFSRQAFYKWQACPLCAREREDEQILEQIRLIHGDDPEFGYRLIADELAAQGIKVSERRVWRICHNNGVFSTIIHARRSGKGKPGTPVHDDMLQHHFHADTLNKAWVVDITEHHTSEGKIYMCAIKDLCSRRIVGYAIDKHMKSRLALAALNDAMVKRGYPSGVIVHSDRGSQFRSRKFTMALRAYKAKGSMGRVGAAGDNAAMESFLSLLQKNVLNRKNWGTRRELSTAITHWIERTYHRKRSQRALGKLTPIEYEAIIKPAVTLAA